MVSNPVYRKYIKYFTRSRLFIYEGPGEVTTLAAIKQILRMKKSKPKLEIVSDTNLDLVKYIYSTIITTRGTVPKDSLLLVTGSILSKYSISFHVLLNNLDWYNSWLVLVCSDFNFLDYFIRNYDRKTVLTYAGGGASKSVFIKNSRASSKKEYYRLNSLDYYRKYL